MNIPPPDDPRWVEIFRSQRTYTFDFLAANMVFTRCAIQAKRDSTQQSLRKLSTEMWEIFSKNAHNPKVANDVKKLFG